MAVTDLRKGSHCVFVLHAHLCVAKCRDKVLRRCHLERLEAILRERCASHGVWLVETNGEAEHVHLLVNMLTTFSPSRLPSIAWRHSGRCSACCPTTAYTTW